MKVPLLISLMALALGAVALKLSLAAPAGPGLGASEWHAAVEPDTRDMLALQVEALLADNEALRDRIGALEQSRFSRARVAPSARLVAVEEFEAFQEEVREALEGLAGQSATGAAGEGDFKDQVATTLSEIRKDEAVGKVRAWQEERLERLDRTMPKMESWLQLSGDQSARMRSALLARYEREAELIRRWEAGESDEVLGEIKGSDREAHLSDVAAFLTPQQLDDYVSAEGQGGKPAGNGN